MIATQADAPRARPEGRRRARLPGQADGPVEGRRRIAEPGDRHHAQARRPARRRPAGNPALGRQRNRRRAARREQRLARPGRGRQDRAAVLLRLGAERDRPRAAQPAPTEGDRHRRRDQPGRRRRDRRADRVPGRAARRQTAADPAQQRHDLEPGCTPAQINGCIYGSWYLLDTTHEKVLAGRRLPPRKPNRTCTPTTTNRRRAQVARRCGSTPAPCSCRRSPSKTHAGKVTNHSPNSWYVLNDDPVLTGLGHHEPAAELRRRRRRHGQPNVTFGFTSHGQERLRSASPRKSPTAARKRSCRASPRKRPSSTSPSCSTAS